MCWSARPASAADVDPLSKEAADAKGGWIVSIGVMPLYEPTFVGSSSHRVDFIPQFSFRREGEEAGFSAPDDGLDYAVYDTPTLKLGPVATIERERFGKTDRALRGLDNYSWRASAGAFVEFWPVEDVVRLRTEVLHGLNGDAGFTANLSADFVKHYGPFTFSAGPRLQLADDDEMQIQFGVSRRAAERNGHVAPFDTAGGLESVGVNATLSYQWSDNWIFTVFNNYDGLVGDAANSPVTQGFGSPDQFTFGAGVTYSFHVGD